MAGLFQAIVAAQAGLRVTLLEADDAPRGASIRNFGLICAATLPLSRHAEVVVARARWAELLQRVGLTPQRTGTLFVAHTARELEVLAQAGVLASAHERAQLLEPTGARALHGALGERCVGALHLADDLRVPPRAAMHRGLQWLEGLPNVVVRRRARAIACERTAGGVRVTLADGSTLEAAHAVVATGREAMTPRLAGPALARTIDDPRAGATPCRLQMLAVAAPAAAAGWPNIASPWSIRRYPLFGACDGLAALLDEPMDAALVARGIHVLIAWDPSAGWVIGDSHTYGELAREHEHDEHTAALILREAAALLHADVELRVHTRWSGVYAIPAAHERQRWTTVDERLHVLTPLGGSGMLAAPALAEATIAAWFGERPGAAGSRAEG